MLGDLGLLFLRLVIGGLFAIHGYPKLFGGSGRTVPPDVAHVLGQGFVQAEARGGPANFAQTVSQVGAPAPGLLAWLVGALEFFGGIMLALGWFTRPLAALLGAEMAYAISRVHWRNGLIGPGGFEFPLAMLGGCVALFLAGPGRFSVDVIDTDDEPSDG
jgi:putative oxidoreductase